MYRYFLFGLALITSLLIAPAGIQAQGVALTMSDVPITWKDFTHKRIKDKHDFVAKTYVSYGASGGYQYESATNIVKLKFNFFAEMNPKKSYVSKTFLKTADSARSQALLNHERGHWIISMLYFHQLVNNLEQFPYTRRFKFQVDSILRDNYAACRKEQLQYDRETNHSKNKEQQLFWEKNLLDRLGRVYGHKIEFPVRFSKEFELSWPQ